MSFQTRWTGEMNRQLKSLWGIYSAEEIGHVMGLSPSRVRTRAEYLGLGRRKISEILEPSWDAWEAAVKAYAEIDGVSSGEIFSGKRSKRVTAARWKAFKAILDTHPRCSIAGLGRVSGFHYATILHGLKRLSGASDKEVRVSGRSSNRRPKIITEAPCLAAE